MVQIFEFFIVEVVRLVHVQSRVHLQYNIGLNFEENNNNAATTRRTILVVTTATVTTTVTATTTAILATATAADTKTPAT